MTPMHMTMFGAWYGGVGGQQGCPSQEGGPRLIRFESPRWRPKATQVRARLGVQEEHVLKTMPMLHMVSILGILYMDGNIISWIFQWHRSHLKIRSKSTGIIEISGRPESIRVLRHRLLGRWPMYHVGAHGGASRGGLHDLTLIYSVAIATLGLGFV